MLTTNSYVPSAKRCNKHGEFLAFDAPPALPTMLLMTDWTPFDFHISFELADFIFSDAELLKKRVNRLLKLWAATLVPRGTLPPIADHANLL